MFDNNKSNGFSAAIYDKYADLTDTSVKLTLKNNTLLRGRIIGFFYNGDHDPSYIAKWHIADTRHLLATDFLGYAEGHLIEHSDIKAILFESDNTFLEEQTL